MKFKGFIEKFNKPSKANWKSLPNEYFEYTENADAEEYIKNFACDTEWDRNLRFSRLRATCKDGSTVMVGNAGDNANQGIGVNETDKIFNNGIEACNSLLKLNSSQDLYYLADNDGKESLGIFFFPRLSWYKLFVFSLVK